MPEVQTKKVIALACSPSKGFNSDIMLDHFILGMRKVEGIEIEKVYLNDISFAHYNFENRNGPSEGESAFKELCDKVQSARGLVIATPTYNFSVPAQLKNFIDRIRFFALDFDEKSKLGQPKGRLDYLSTYFIVTGGTPEWAEKILFFAFPAFWLRGVFLYYRAKVMAAIYTGDVEARQNPKILKKCERAGERFAKKVKKGERHGILEDIFWRPPEAKGWE